MKNFRTYDLAVNFYHLSTSLALPGYLRDQLGRAASSVVLNLAEGNARKTQADRKRFFNIAFASLKECQAILELASGDTERAAKVADALGAHLYRLIQNVTASRF